MNKYLVQYVVKTDLSSHIDDWNFRFNGATVKFLFSTKKGDRLKVQVILDAINYQGAQAKAHDAILTNVLDAISFIMKSSLTILELDYVLKAQRGLKERIIYNPIYENETFSLFLQNEHKQEIQNILRNKDLEEKYWLSLRWLRFGYRARSIIERFTYYWLAFERIIGETKIYKKCPKCGSPMAHSGTSKEKARKLFTKYDTSIIIESEKAEEFEKIWKLRQKVFHGGKKPDQKHFQSLFMVTNKLGRIVETIISEKIKPRTKITDEYPFPTMSRISIHAHYKFTTGHPELEFPLDYPTNEQIKQYHQNHESNNSLKFRLAAEEEVENY